MVDCGCVCVCWRGSLRENGLGSVGGAAIGAGLCHVPRLTTLLYVRWAEGMGGDACVCAYVGGWFVVEVWVCSWGEGVSVEYESHVRDVMWCEKVWVVWGQWGDVWV